MDREKVIENLERMLSNYDMLDDIVINKNNEMLIFHRAVAKSAIALLKEQEDLGTELTNAVELIHKKNERIEKLLKEQEAVEPKTEPSAKGYWFTCGACGWWLFEVRDTVHFDDRKRIRFCASCGRSVKWE